MSLSEYQKKRSFNKTSEPAGSAREARAGRPIFVVQLHHASHRHYDFRLQVGNVLRSWAVPKGPSFDPAVKRLAAQVEDHPLGYASFEGEIPEGQYGAGHVAVFDTGIWSTAEDPVKQLAKGHLRFELFGRKLKGGWHLIRTRGGGKKPQWLLVKNQDRYASDIEADDLIDDLPAPTAGASAKRAAGAKKKMATVAGPVAKPSTRAAKKAAPASAKPPRSRVDWGKRAAKLPGARAARMPKALPELQLATLVSTPSAGPSWVHEIKWDGYRITTMISDGRVTLWSRNGLEWTSRLPDIVAALETWRLADGVFDGELIAKRGSQADFSALQATLSGEQAASLTYVLFDVLHVNGVSLTRCALRDRKALLAQMLDAPVAHLAFSSHIEGDGAQAFALATKQGFEGIISKRGDRPHVPGRGGDWTKCKQLDSEEFAVVGVTPPKGNRTGLGALLLARHDARRGWIYAGKFGSGLSDSQLAELAARIGNAGGKSPTVIVPANDTDLRSARWFEPMFVVEVYSRGRGGNGLLRQPSLKTLRLDKSVADLVETPAPSASRAKQAKRGTSATKEAGMTLTHPERVVFPDDGYTKQQVADYYEAVMDHLLPGIVDRPLSLIRCPAGIGGQCFFQKHEISGVEGVDRVRLKEGSGVNADYLVVRDAAAVMELVQFNALEFHPWGAKADVPDAADLLVFDLDPGGNVAWAAVRAAARRIRDLLAALKLQSFVRTSGGKGLHVVVPLNPAVDWDVARPFAESFAKAMARMEPEKFVATASKARRDGKIFVDYLRNGRGATSVASYSLRARATAPVAVPLTWDELPRVASGAAFTIENVPRRLARLKSEPWSGFSTIRQSLDHVDGLVSGRSKPTTVKKATPKSRRTG